MSIDAFLQSQQQWLLFLPWSCYDNSMLPIVLWFLFCCRSCCATTGLSAKILSSAAKNRLLTPWGLNMQQWNNRNTKWSKLVLKPWNFFLSSEYDFLYITGCWYHEVFLKPTQKFFLTFQIGIYIYKNSSMFKLVTWYWQWIPANYLNALTS